MQIQQLLREYQSAPSGRVSRAAILELLVERELPWLVKQLGKSTRSKRATDTTESLGD